MEKKIFQCFSYFVYKLREYFVEVKRLLLLQQPSARRQKEWQGKGWGLSLPFFLWPLTVDGAASAAPYHRFLSFMARSISRLAARSAMAWRLS